MRLLFAAIAALFLTSSPVLAQYPLPSPDLCLLIRGPGVCTSTVPPAPAVDCIGALPHGCSWVVDGACYVAAAAARLGELLAIRSALCNLEEDAWQAFDAERARADADYLRCMENAVLPSDYLECSSAYEATCAQLNQGWDAFRDAVVGQWLEAVTVADAAFLLAAAACCEPDCPPAVPAWELAWIEAREAARR